MPGVQFDGSSYVMPFEAVKRIGPVVPSVMVSVIGARGAAGTVAGEVSYGVDIGGRGLPGAVAAIGGVVLAGGSY